MYICVCIYNIFPVDIRLTVGREMPNFAHMFTGVNLR